MSVRQPVPRTAPMPVKSRSTKGTPGEFPFTEMPKNVVPIHKPENNHTKEKNPMNKLKNYYNANKVNIKHKAIVWGGAAAGLLLAGLATELAKKAVKPEVIVITESELAEIEAEVSPVTDEIPVTKTVRNTK